MRPVMFSSVIKAAGAISLIAIFSMGGPGTAGATVLLSSVTVDPGVNSPDSALSDFHFSTGQSATSLTSSFGSSSFSGSAAATAGFDQLHVFASTQISDYSNQSYESLCGPSSICGPGGSGPALQPASATAIASDTFTITGGTGTGYLKLVFNIDGTTSLISSGDLDGPIAQGIFTLYRGQFGSGTSFLSSIGFTGDTIYNSPLISFTYGVPFALTFWVDAFVDAADYLASANLYSIDGTADFGNTITLSQLFLFDSTGLNQINGNVSSESETQYNVAAAAPNGVSEPPSLILLLSGLLCAGFMRRRQVAGRT